jgi:hypothetical protein
MTDAFPRERFWQVTATCHDASVVRTLITGMSAVGKSSVLSELIKLGHRAVDLDTDEWSLLVPDDSSYADHTTGAPMDWRWREEKVHALLAAAVTACYSSPVPRLINRGSIHCSTMLSC